MEHFQDFYTKQIRDKGTKAEGSMLYFSQCKGAKTILDEELFDADVVNYSDIEEHGRYYGGFVFIPPVASHICATRRTTREADAAHCDGVGPKSYGTTFEVVAYGYNNHLFP